MKESPIYTVEREYLGKVTVEELIKKIIKSHRQNDTSRKAS